MKFLTVENLTNRPLFIDDVKGRSIALPPKKTLENIELDEVQVQNFEAINIVKAVKEEVAAEKKTEKKAVEVITLPEEFTAKSLAEDFKVDELKAYCKANKITGITGKNELELAEMIVADYEAKNADKE